MHLVNKELLDVAAMELSPMRGEFILSPLRQTLGVAKTQ